MITCLLFVLVSYATLLGHHVLYHHYPKLAKALDKHFDRQVNRLKRLMGE